MCVCVCDLGLLEEAAIAIPFFLSSSRCLAEPGLDPGSLKAKADFYTFLLHNEWSVSSHGPKGRLRKVQWCGDRMSGPARQLVVSLIGRRRITSNGNPKKQRKKTNKY